MMPQICASLFLAFTCVAGSPAKDLLYDSQALDNSTFHDEPNLNDPAFRSAVAASLGQTNIVKQSVKLLTTRRNSSPHNGIVSSNTSYLSTNGAASIGNFGTSRRDVDEIMNITAQRGFMIACDNSTVYSVAVEPREIKPFLESAVVYATREWEAFTNGTDSISDYFRYTNGSLSFVAQSYGEATSGNAFNWGDFATVARWLASVTPSGSRDNRTWIGTVSDSQGTPYVDFALSPAFGDTVIDTTNRTMSDINNDILKAEKKGNRLRLTRRTRKARFHHLGTTGFLMAVYYGRETIDRLNLMSLAGLVNTQIRMDKPGGSYSHYLAQSPLRNHVAQAIGNDAYRVFEIATKPGQRFTHTLLVLISDVLYGLAGEMMSDVKHSARSLYGEIVDAQNQIVATWQLGYPSAKDAVLMGLSCPLIQVTSLNGNPYDIQGCFTRFKDEL